MDFDKFTEKNINWMDNLLNMSKVVTNNSIPSKGFSDTLNIASQIAFSQKFNYSKITLPNFDYLDKNYRSPMFLLGGLDKKTLNFHESMKAMANIGKIADFNYKMGLTISNSSKIGLPNWEIPTSGYYRQNFGLNGFFPLKNNWVDFNNSLLVSNTIQPKASVVKFVTNLSSLSNESNDDYQRQIMEMLGDVSNNAFYGNDTIESSTLAFFLDKINSIFDSIINSDSDGVITLKIKELYKLLSTAQGKAYVLLLIVSFFIAPYIQSLPERLIKGTESSTSVTSNNDNSSNNSITINIDKSVTVENKEINRICKTTKSKTLRTQPNKNANILCKIPIGTEITVMTKKGRWLEINYITNDSLTSGWTFNNFLK